MDVAHKWLFLTAAILLASILVGRLSARIGAPLLLAFLGLGLFAGQEGVLGIRFNDLGTGYLIGSAALAVILLDGGMRARRTRLHLGLGPASILATIGVVVTAVMVGAVAALALGTSWTEGLLVGSIVASTDAAAVFLVLHHRGMRINERVDAVLETESGINDPVAVFLTAGCVQLLTLGASPAALLGELILAMGLGGLIGGLGGMSVLALANRLELAPGLYPILVLAAGIAIFAGTQLVGGSGYLAVYLTGIILGNAKLRAARLTARFFDGLAWLAQIVLFVMLGLFIHPAALWDVALPALAIAMTLMLIARPLAVYLCLLPFRFSTEERVFIAWTGLRGAVPIFLAMFPLLAGLPGAPAIFSVTFVVVLASLIVQGWTVVPAMRWLRLELPPAPEPHELLEFDLPRGFGREISVYRVARGAPAIEHDFAALHLPKRTRIIAVLRDGTVMRSSALERLLPDDVVLAIAPPEQLHRLDTLFAMRRPSLLGAADPLGDFALNATISVGAFADLYGLQAADADRDKPLGDVIGQRLNRPPTIGDRVHFDAVDLVVRAVDDDDHIIEIGVALEPVALPLERLHLTPPLRRALSRVVAPLIRLKRRLAAS
jgi:cell volume regulation protein A